MPVGVRVFVVMTAVYTTGIIVLTVPPPKSVAVTVRLALPVVAPGAGFSVSTPLTIDALTSAGLELTTENFKPLLARTTGLRVTKSAGGTGIGVAAGIGPGEVLLVGPV